ncbi:MAG TPA: hypothetical protein HA319_01590 [Nitrosopumilaceae archaeon]|nr:hypothetical protein [Nitrosopumilaceae archaeon]
MKTLRIAVMAILALILLVPAAHIVFADVRSDRPELKYFELPKNGTLTQDSTNNIGIRVAFHFPAGEEVVDSFKSFTTKGTGFDRNRGVLPVELQGVISNDKPLLYEAVDKAFEIGTGKTVQHDFKIFDIDVLFTRADQNYRIFSYENCIVKNYNIDTLFDKEETYMAKTKFAYVENIEFECTGLQMWNPTYEIMKEDKIAELTADAVAKMNHKNDKSGDAKSKEVTKAEMTIQKLYQKTFR